MGSDGFWNVITQCDMDTILSKSKNNVRNYIQDVMCKKKLNDNITMISLYFNNN